MQRNPLHRKSGSIGFHSAAEFRENHSSLPSRVFRTSPAVRSGGGRGRIRTSVARKERQIYSLLVLTTHPPVRTGENRKEGHCASAKFKETRSRFLRDAGTCLPQQIGNSPLIRKYRQSWRRDLNPRPSDYKSDALPAELRQHGANQRNISKGHRNCKGPLWKTCANFTLLASGLQIEPTPAFNPQDRARKPYSTPLSPGGEINLSADRGASSP